jgi:hypothetical protein
MKAKRVARRPARKSGRRAQASRSAERLATVSAPQPRPFLVHALCLRAHELGR